MNRILKKPIRELGYHFVEKKYLPGGQDEYYLRNRQNAERPGDKSYRHLSAKELETLVRNNNTSDNWNNIWVTDFFDAGLVKRCHFYGLVRIGKLEPYYLEFHNLRLPVGLYNSTVNSCDIGDNVVVDNVNSLAHYIIGNESILVNVNEMSTTSHSKFGNGIIKDGEEESVRIWMELCNENGGRKVMPFDGMLPGDAFLWSKYRANAKLMRRFEEFTKNRIDHHRGYYGTIGERCIIKNCKILKDVKVGNDAYIKGANKLKNLTINSKEEAVTQIGEGCELVNGIIGYGCRIFYGVKAVRFMMAPFSNLKYGARLLNSYLGSNATVSCCEVLNSLIYPAHEQHHNNSFLCAALLQGQSNMAAGATIGSNHNSRGADGELIAGRGFWPGLCVSLKHNSRFASFTLIAKGDFPAEINLPLPFSLLSNDTSKDQLVIMPAYWFMYNMYALARNSWKHNHRDKRTEKIQFIEYDFLAPDTVEEMLNALPLLEYATGKAFYKNKKEKRPADKKEIREKGAALLNRKAKLINDFTISLEGIESSKRPVILIKIREAYETYKKMVHLYTINQLTDENNASLIKSFNSLKRLQNKAARSTWINVGGQLISQPDVEQLTRAVTDKNIKSWEEVHYNYRDLGRSYRKKKLLHSLATLPALYDIEPSHCTRETWIKWVEEGLQIANWVKDQVNLSRRKDYNNPFRKMVYDNKKEMEKIVGKFEDDSFVTYANEQTQNLNKEVKKLLHKLEV